MSDRDDRMRSFSRTDGRVMQGSPSPARKSSKLIKKRRKRHSRSRSIRSRSRSFRSRSRSYRSRSFSRERRDSYDDRRNRGRQNSRSPGPRKRKHFGDRENPKESKCIGVFGMNFNTSQSTVADMFEKFGPLEGVQVIQDYHTGKSRGFGFVYFKYVEDAVEAKESLPGTELDGHKIRVDYSITQRAHSPTPGSYLGHSKGNGGFSRESRDSRGRGGRMSPRRRSPPRGHY